MDLPTRTTVVGPDQHDATLAALVRGLYEGMPWSKARELVSAGKVKLDDQPQRDPAMRVRAGSKVEVDPAGRRHKPPTPTKLDLVHIDHDIVVVDKPGALLTVPFDDDDERDTLFERTRKALIERQSARSGKRREFEWLGVVQRLDKDTSGLLVFARNQAARVALANQFRAHAIERRYLALVWGRAEPGVHDTFLVPDRGDGRRGSWRGPKPPSVAKQAITEVHVEQRLLGPWGEVTRIACTIETGRQHQIRIHLSEAGCPLLGERVYDRQYETRPIQPERTMLHAATLGFRHPTSGQPLRFEATPPADYRALLAQLGGG